VRRLALIVAVLWPVDAIAFGPISADGAHVSVASLRVAVATGEAHDVWTVEADVLARAPEVLWQLQLPKSATVEAADGDAFTALAEFTSPRLERFDAIDPCAPSGSAGNGRPVTDRRWRGTPAGERVEAVPGDARQLAKWAVAGGAWRAKLGKGRRHRLAPLRITVPAGTPLPLHTIAKHTAPGALLQVELWLLHAKSVVEIAGLTQDTLPTEVELPLAALDDARTLLADIRQTRLRRAGPSYALLEYAAPGDRCDPCTIPPPEADAWRALGWTAAAPFITRWHAKIGRDQLKRPVRLHATKNQRITQTRWFFRPLWTGPAPCKAKARHEASLRSHEMATARTWATLTGRPMQEMMQGD